MHPGLTTHLRADVLPAVPALLTPIALTKSLGTPTALAGARLDSINRIAVRAVATFDRCVIDARLTGKTLITIKDSLIAAMLDSTGFHITGCRIGSIDRPDGTHRRPTEDGIRPCPLPGSAEPALPSTIADSDIVNTDGLYGSAHMDGVQLWQGGNLTLARTKIHGWWNGAVFLKTDHGPIDRVTIDSCSLAGAHYFQVRVIDGGKGHGRPTNITITNNVIDRGTKGSANPVNTGDDRCSAVSQTKYVRTEAERLDPTWVVFNNNVTPDGVEIVPRTGWHTP